MSKSPRLNKRLVMQIADAIPYVQFLGLKIISIEKGKIEMLLPWKEEFLGYGEIKSVNLAIIYGLFDSLSGAVVFSEIKEVMNIVTLSMRVEHISPPIYEKDIYASANLIKIDSDLAFVNFSAYQIKNNLFAVGSANFKLHSSPLKNK